MVPDKVTLNPHSTQPRLFLQTNLIVSLSKNQAAHHLVGRASALDVPKNVPALYVLVVSALCSGEWSVSVLIFAHHLF